MELQIKKIKFLCVPPTFQEEFIENVTRAYFGSDCHDKDKFISEHFVFTETMNILSRIASVEVFEDEHYYNYQEFHQIDEREMCENNRIEPYMLDIVAVMRHHQFSFYSDELGEFFNLPTAEVW